MRRWWGALLGDFCYCGGKFSAGDSTREADTAGGSAWGAAVTGGDSADGEAEGGTWSASEGDAEGAGEAMGGKGSDCSADRGSDEEGSGATVASLGRGP